MAYQESPGSDKLKRVTVVLKAGEAALPQGCFVELSAGGDPNEVVKLAGDTSVAYGITEMALTAGDVGTAVTDGECLARSGAAYVNGAKLTANGDSEAITATTGDRIYAIAREAATAADQLRVVLFKGVGTLEV
jgi:hypothetical protein